MAEFAKKAGGKKGGGATEVYHSLLFPICAFNLLSMQLLSIQSSSLLLLSSRLDQDLVELDQI